MTSVIFVMMSTVLTALARNQLELRRVKKGHGLTSVQTKL
jgi:hypothetical protein